MNRMLRIAVVVVAAVVGAVPSSALAAPVVQASHQYGKPIVTWSPPLGALGGELEIRKTPPSTSGEFGSPWHEEDLEPGQTVWRGEAFSPGTYYLHVASFAEPPASCDPETEDCPDVVKDWSEVVTLVIPRRSLVLQKSIAYVALGMTMAQVRGLLGDYDSGGAAGGYVGQRYDAEKLAVTYTGRPRRVVGMMTWNALYRVEGTNIGKGSTERQLKATIGGVRCLSFRWYGSMNRYCWTGTRARGRVITQFWMHRGKILTMSVGRVRDLRGDPFRTDF